MIGRVIGRVRSLSVPHRLVGKVAVVTGASRGIGHAVAVRLAQEGATVAVNHWQDEREAEATLHTLREASAEQGHSGGGAHCAIDADVGSAIEVTSMFVELLRRYSRIDILVNNAGFQQPTPGESFDEGVLMRVLAVDLVGPALCSRAAITHFLDRPGGGVIINTTSVHEMVPKPGYLAYSMAKGGLGNLTRTLALEFADKEIRVNSVGPGAVLTNMNAAWKDDPRARANVESHIPVGYAARAEDIAPVFAFLASDDARYITGQTIFACGGVTLYGEFKVNWAS